MQAEDDRSDTYFYSELLDFFFLINQDFLVFIFWFLNKYTCTIFLFLFLFAHLPNCTIPQIIW